MIGAGGVGSAFAAIARRRGFFAEVVLADIDRSRARAAAERTGDKRFSAIALDASDRAGVAECLAALRIDAVLNAVDPRFVLPVFGAALDAGVTYLDMALSPSTPDSDAPYERCGCKLGDEQFAQDAAWRDRGQLAIVGMGVEPGLSDVFARYAADRLFVEIDEIGVRDGGDLVVAGHGFAPTFSAWTTIEECLNPAVVWDRRRGWFTMPPFSEPETFTFPSGIGPVECVNVEHEEVVLIPRAIDCRKVTFKTGLGAEFIEVLQTLHRLGLDRTEPVTVRGDDVSPRDVVAACLPDPATLGAAMTGRTCAGTLVRGTGVDGGQREVYLYHVVDNEETMGRDGCQAVLWQAALNPVVALELLAEGVWGGSGVVGPESFPAEPFLDLLDDHGSPWEVEERPTPVGHLDPV